MVCRECREFGRECYDIVVIGRNSDWTGQKTPGINGHLCRGDGSIDVDLVDKLLERVHHNHHHRRRYLNADGESAVIDDRKAALPWDTSAERALGEGRSCDSRGHAN